MIIAISIFFNAVLLAFLIQRNRHYRSALYLATKGYWAEMGVCSPLPPRWYSPKPEWIRGHLGVDDGYSLYDAVKRERLLEERRHLGIPTNTLPKYQPGDFAKDEE